MLSKHNVFLLALLAVRGLGTKRFRREILVADRMSIKIAKFKPFGEVFQISTRVSKAV